MATICSAVFHFPKLSTFTACTKQMALFQLSLMETPHTLIVGTAEGNVSGSHERSHAHTQNAESPLPSQEVRGLVTL